MSADLSTGGASLHGSDATKRQATMELLFFAHLGDLERCLRLVSLWSLNVKHAPKTLFKDFVVL